MKTISVMNYKGGVGKTTISANIAAELAFNNKKVLAIDLDPQANLTFSFVDVNEWQRLDSVGKTIKHWFDDFLDSGGDSGLSGLITRPANINNQLSAYNASGYVDLISSHLELINVDLELATHLGGTTDRTIRSNYLRVLSRLKKKIEDIKGEYDVVIIDCPPNFNIVTQNAIVASDLYLVPAKPDYLSTLGIDQLIRHITELKNKYNEYVAGAKSEDWTEIDPQILGVIFTMVSIYGGEPISALRNYMSQVRRTGTVVFESYMRENKTLFSSAPENGVPVVLKADVSTGTHKDVRSELEGIVSELRALAKI